MVDRSWIIIGIAAVVTVLALLALIKGVRGLRLDAPDRSWPSTSGRVTGSRLTDGENVVVEYHYKVDGVWYDGDVLHAHQSADSRAENRMLTRKYPNGAEVPVYYDPADPSTAVLIRALPPRWARTTVTGSLTAMITGVTALAVGIAHIAAERPEPPPTPAKTATADLDAPTGVAVGSSGAVYVCDGAQGGRVLRVGDSRDLTAGTIRAPVDLALGPSGTIYVTDHSPVGSSGRLWVFTLSEIDNRSEVVVNGIHPLADLKDPGAVAVDSAGTVYAAETTSGRVLRFASRAKNGTEFFTTPDGGTPTDIAIDGAGSVFVSDSKNSRIWKIASQGDTSPKLVPASFLVRPQGLAVDKDGKLYVADAGNHRVLKFSPDLNTAEEVPFEGLQNPYGVAVDQQGNVYVTDNSKGRVLEFSPAYF